jgi:hypothetical protein
LCKHRYVHKSHGLTLPQLNLDVFKVVNFQIRGLRFRQCVGSLSSYKTGLLSLRNFSLRFYGNLVFHNVFGVMVLFSGEETFSLEVGNLFKLIEV